MNVVEAMDALATLPDKGWKAYCTDKNIRLRPPVEYGHGECCPITAIALDKTKNFRSSFDWEEAARDELDMSYWNALDIVRAADNSNLQASQTLRNRMLTDLRIDPKDCQ